MSETGENPWRIAAESVIEYGKVGPDHPEHLVQHLVCTTAGQQETVYTRCCRQPVALGRLMWPCEIPRDTGRSLDCCERPFVVYGEAAR